MRMVVVNCSSREGMGVRTSGSGPPGIACGPPGCLPLLPAGEGDGAGETSLPLAEALDLGVRGEACALTSFTGALALGRRGAL